MHLTHLGLTDFRSYPSVEVDLAPGITTFLGRNGQGKTNLVEAAGYLASLSSHRVFTDAPLVRQGAHRAAVRAVVVRAGRPTQLEMEINPGRANRARLNRSPLSRPREILGSLRTVLFAPEDLALVKGDPSERRRFLDDLLVARQPRWSGVRSDYDKVLKQRNALLRSASSARRGRPPLSGPADEPTGTLEVWTTHLALVGSALQYARLRLLRDLLPYLATCYDRVSDSDGHALATYQSSLAEDLRARIAGGEVPAQEDLADGLHASAQGLRDREIERGVSLVGPHRDDIQLSLGDLPARGYASHGESWSFALGLRLAAYQLLRHDLGEDPVLVLDDVFAELDAGRRERLAEIVADCEQVLVTAAVDQDVPRAIASGGATFDVRLGQVQARG